MIKNAMQARHASSELLPSKAMIAITGLSLGFLVGAIPTLSMLIASAALAQFDVPPKIEACFQNFAAGLILAAVAAELFPLMLESVSTKDSMIGISVGFVCGLGLIYGVEAVIGYFESMDEEGVSDMSTNGSFSKFTKPAGLDERKSDLESQLLLENDSDSNSDGAITNPILAGKWEEAPVVLASQAFQSEQHRHHISEHLVEISDLIAGMEEKCTQMLENASLSQAQVDEAAENIDENIHTLQYKIDHCKRLVQGSESELSGRAPRTWVTEDSKIRMKQRLRNLKLTVDHIIEHMEEQGETNAHLMKEIHAHMEEVDQQIIKFHHSVENVASRWHRTRALPTPELGATLPMGLVIPVTVDCFVDGFLIGVSCALSPTAGIILGCANCLEMSFLGMAFSSRIGKCTGSSWLSRFIALYVPPLIMCLSAGLGAFVGDAAKSIPAIFVSFVGFGTVALLFLVCNELLIEAKEAQGDDERWWISIMVFAGVYVVLMMANIFD